MKRYAEDAEGTQRPLRGERGWDGVSFLRV